MKLISIVTPMYNESEMVQLFFKNINACVESLKAEKQGIDFEIVVVNDGSRDDTLDKLIAQTKLQSNLSVVNLSRNFGQEPAVFAGVSKAKGDALIVMDCDMQDPPELIGQLVDGFLDGYDVVNAKRSDRKVDSAFQRNTAKFYYSLLNAMSYKVDYPENVNNFRLISRRVADVILKYPSNEKLFRNAVAQAGFKTLDIEFVRQPRAEGKSKVNPKSMIRLALTGIADSTTAPLGMAFKFALVFMLCASVMLVAALVFAILAQVGVNFAQIVAQTQLFLLFTIFFFFMFFTGVILMFVSINGFYIGKTFWDVKGRPMYTVENVYTNENNENE